MSRPDHRQGYWDRFWEEPLRRLYENDMPFIAEEIPGWTEVGRTQLLKRKREEKYNSFLVVRIKAKLKSIHVIFTEETRVKAWDMVMSKGYRDITWDFKERYGRAILGRNMTSVNGVRGARRDGEDKASSMHMGADTAQADEKTVQDEKRML